MINHHLYIGYVTSAYHPGAKPMIIAAMPAYNEEEHIAKVVDGASKHVDQVIVVDDGSTDATSAIASTNGAVVVRHKTNRGYGAAIRTCFDTAKKMGADMMITLDADGQHNPDEIPYLIHAMNNGIDVVIGSRFPNNNGHHIPLYRRFGMKVLDIATNMVGGVNTSDSQSGFRAYSRKAIKVIEITRSDMSAGSDILLQAKKHNLRIGEVPITCSYDSGSTSSQNPVHHGILVLIGILHSRSLCIGTSGLLISAAMLIGLWIADIHELSFALLLLFVISICAGIILQSIAKAFYELKKGDL